MLRLLVALLCFSTGCVHAQTVLTGGGTGAGKGTSAPPIIVCGITTQSLPAGVVGTAYSTQIATAGCVAPVTFSVITGSLPSWVSTTWPNATGIIAGTPDAAGSFSFIVQASDALGHAAIFNSPLNITSTNSPGSPLAPDAALSSWDTSMAGTPTSNQTICVGTPINAALLPGGSCLSTFAATTAGSAAALNAVACGQVINWANVPGLAPLTLPSNKKCANNAWIWLAFHDLSDPVFPPENVRADPSYIGIPQTAMPYYPYPGANATPNVAARHMSQILVPATSNNPCLRMSIPSSGTNTPSIGHWRIMGLDCTRDQSSDGLTALISLDFQPNAVGQDCALTGSGNTALPTNAAACAADQYDHIVIDRNVIHGDPVRQTVRAISLGGGTFLAVKDNYIYDILDTFAGGQGDAQSFAGGFGHGYTGVGDWLFQNNFSASSSEGTLFCGAFTEAKSPVTNADGIPSSVIWNRHHFYKPVLWDTQRGQTLNETLVNEGTSYPPIGDQEIVWQPTAFELQQGLAMSLNNTWLNDSAGGWNRFNVTGTPPNNTGTATVDGVAFTTVTPANGILTKANVAVGAAPWRMENIIQWTYTACAGTGNPVAACTAATTPGTHTIVFGGVVLNDGRADVTKLGNNRTLTTTITATVTSGANANQIALTPSAPDLQIQPSYSDASGNNRNFAYVFQAITNFSSVSMTWKVDGITNGNTTVGRICSVTAVPCVSPAANDSRVVYVSGSQGLSSLGSHTISVTSAAGTTTSQAINVSLSSPIWGYDLKAITVKNMWEAKCLTRGLLENSLLENTWGSQGNSGGQDNAILNQAINQTNQTTDGSGASVGYGPGNISDFNATNLHVLSAGGGLTVAALNQSKGVHRLSYSNILMEDLNGTRWGHGFLHPQFNVFVQFSGADCVTAPCTVLSWTSATTPLANDINFSHITSVGGTATTKGINSWLSVANWTGQFTLGPFSVKDSIFQAPGTIPFTNNNGQNNDCNHNNITETEFTVFQGTGYTPPAPCFTSYSLARNLLLDNTSLASVYATPTIWNNVASTDPTVFRNNNPNGVGDYRLAPGSPYAAGGARAASDGLDLGADVAAIMASDAIVRWGGATPLTITTANLTNATHGTAYSATLTATGGTGQLTWSLPGGIRPPGSEDILDYAAMPLPDRNSFHLSGTLSKYFKVDGGLLWWMKSSSGCPWDGEMYTDKYVFQWFTEGPTFSNCSGNKTYVNPVALWPRYHVPGAFDSIVNPGPNKYKTTENCGVDNLAQIDNQDVKGELSGPFTDITWTTTYGGNIPNNQPYLLATKYIKGVAGVYQNREQYWLVKGYGQVQWCPSTWNGSGWTVGTCTRETTKTAGGAPAPNFACTVPNLPVTNGLPPGTLQTTSPSMNLHSDTGVIDGTPLTIGNSVFVVQVEDSVGHIAQRTLALTVQ
jgi:hypothetical protein